jgi:Raf kinase inhibitor-like YbhB/YbcL family protein
MAEFELSSPAFDDGEAIPRENTCDGSNESPTLRWTNVPDGTRTLAVIVHDPDAPSGDFVHWLGWNLDPDVGGLEQGVPAPVQGTNGFGRLGYDGPCPPEGHGPHRYYLRLYAIDTDLELEPGAARDQLQNEMEGHVLSEAELLGLYERE